MLQLENPGSPVLKQVEKKAGIVEGPKLLFSSLSDKAPSFPCTREEKRRGEERRGEERRGE